MFSVTVEKFLVHSSSKRDWFTN